MIRALAMPLVCLSATLFCKGVQGSEITFYRCTDAQGALTVQNMPCPKGMQQTTKVMQAVQPPAPTLVPDPIPAAPAALPAVSRLMPGTPPAAAEAEPAAVPAIPARALPALLRCQTRAGEAYLHVGDEAPSRCEPMQVTGLDGNPRTGAGDACEVVRDRCTPVSPEQRCESWLQHLRDAERRWRFADTANATALRADFEALQAMIAASECAGAI